MRCPLIPLPQFYINAIFYISMIGFLVTLGALEEIWKALGGSIRLVQTRVGILLPEVVPLLLIACLSIYYDQQALTLAPWCVCVFAYGVDV